MKNIVFVLFLLPLSVYAQRKEILMGNPKDLRAMRGQTSYNMVFNYDSMLVGRDLPEMLYLAEKKNVWNAREPGKGAELEKMWFADRRRRYEPTFIKNFVNVTRVNVKDSTARYTLLVKTTHTEGGWSLGVVNLPANVDVQLWVIDTADRNKVIIKMGFFNLSGLRYQGGDFEMTQRIQYAYIQAGKTLGGFFWKYTH
jgi:hypothetical protein